jgi:hypothetical protein
MSEQQKIKLFQSIEKITDPMDQVIATVLVEENLCPGFYFINRRMQNDYN